MYTAIPKVGRAQSIDCQFLVNTANQNGVTNEKSFTVGLDGRSFSNPTLARSLIRHFDLVPTTV